MRYPIIIGAAVLALTACQTEKEPAAQADKAAAAAAVDFNSMNEMQKISYAIGQDQARGVSEHVKNYAAMGIQLDTDMILQGSKDFYQGKEGLTEEQLKEQFTSLQEQYRDAASKKQEADAQENVAKGAAFMAENAKKEGVVQTESGLQYRVITAAEGPKPAATDTVKVHYKGTLIDGEEFDSSYSRNQPATFPLNGVIKGWTEGVQLMSVGSKYEFVIPAELAYGDRASARIPANSTLVFEVELLEIVAPKTEAKPETKSE